MRKVLALVGVSGILVTAASAAPITPFSFYGGYFFGTTFHNSLGNSVRFSGLELGVQDSLVSLPILGSVSLGVSAVIGGAGSGVNGTLWRGYADYKTPVVPGSSIYGIAGFNYNYATGTGFSNKQGFGTEIGLGIPIKIGLPVGPGVAIEARYRFAQAATSGLSVGLNVSF